MSTVFADGMDVAGIDIGSSAVKVVVLHDRGLAGAEVRAGLSERMRRRDPRKLAEELFHTALAECGLAAEDLGYVASTGDAEELTFRSGHFYGMTTHARGAVFLEPEVRAVLDVGALHARGVQIDARARVLGSRMTSQCASGSGQFLENICRYLGVTMEAIGPLSLQSTKPEKCSSICAVLAETDVINMVSRGVPTADIVKGIHESMAGRYLKLLTSLGVEGPVLVTGGLASDVGLMSALREAAQGAGGRIELRNHPRSVLAGALGAALWGAFRARKLAEKGLTLRVGGGP